LPIGGEFREQVRLLLALLGENVGGRFAFHLDNLEVVIVHPDSALKIALTLFGLLWSNVENVAVQVIFLLLSLVVDVVLGKFVGTQSKGEAAFNVLVIFGA